MIDDLPAMILIKVVKLIIHINRLLHTLRNLTGEIC